VYLGYFLKEKRLGCGFDHLTPSNVEVKNEEAIPLIPP
jgi:hypothetical protein